MKICEICHDEFNESRSDQKYCRGCGKDPEGARKKYIKAEIINKINAGDLYKVNKVTCKDCGKVILTTYKRTFCSTACRENNRIKTAKCPVCGDKLINKGNRSGRGYCCDECKQFNAIKRAKENGSYVPCEVCGKEFIRKNYSNRFCSKDCYKKLIEENRERKKAEQNDIKVYKARETECKHCGKSFVLKRGSMKQKFCTEECRKASVAENKQKGLEILNLGIDTNICIVCKTSQSQCEMFTSNFVYLPDGAQKKRVNNKFVVVSCPKFKG